MLPSPLRSYRGHGGVHRQVPGRHDGLEECSNYCLFERASTCAISSCRFGWSWLIALSIGLSINKNLAIDASLWRHLARPLLCDSCLADVSLDLSQRPGAQVAARASSCCTPPQKHLLSSRTMECALLLLNGTRTLPRRLQTGCARLRENNTTESHDISENAVPEKSEQKKHRAVFSSSLGGLRTPAPVVRNEHPASLRVRLNQNLVLKGWNPPKTQAAPREIPPDPKHVGL